MALLAKLKPQFGRIFAAIGRLNVASSRRQDTLLGHRDGELIHTTKHARDD